MSSTLKLKLMAADHAQTNGAGYPTVFTCVRKSATKIRCDGTAEQTIDRDINHCDYTGFVTNRRTVKRKKRGRKWKRVVRWKAVHKLTVAECSVTPKLYLEEIDAVAAVGAQGRADYDVNVNIRQLKRVSDTQFVGWASWTEYQREYPYEPLFYCTVDFDVNRISPDQVVAAFSGQSCSIIPRY